MLTELHVRLLLKLKMKIKAIFYDFDGVIKESTQIKTDAFYEIYLPYGKRIALQAKQHHIENGGISRYEKFKYYHENFLNISLDKNEIQTLAERFSHIVLQKVIESNYVTGALESITKLVDKYDQYIITGTPQKEIELIVEKLEISHLFKGVFGSPESKIDISTKILNTNNLKSEEVVFIGDATTDYKAALHHHFHFILREHEENSKIFEKIDIIKTNDLINLEDIFFKINA